MNRRRLLSIVGQILHAALVLTLTILLFRLVHYAFSLLVEDARTGSAAQVQTESNQQEPQPPTPEEMVSSLPTCDTVKLLRG